jgi:DNA-binding GntR family transcriptional regulator
VREALRLLESAGLVIKDGRRGFSVTELSRHELRDMYEVFFVVEELYTRLAAPRMTSPVLDQLREIVTQMEPAVRKNDASAYFSANLEFHSAILEASGNVFLRRFYRMLGRQTLRYRRISLALTERRRQSLQEPKEGAPAAQERGDEGGDSGAPGTPGAFLRPAEVHARLRGMGGVVSRRACRGRSGVTRALGFLPTT